MRIYIFIYSMCFFTIIFFSIYANANNITKRIITNELTCAPRDVAIYDVEKRLNLKRTGLSVTSQNQVVEIYSNRYKWLIMITGTDKITCGFLGGEQEFIFE